MMKVIRTGFRVPLHSGSPVLEVNDVQPSGVQGFNRPLHTMTQVFLGLPLVDNGYLEDAAREAAARKRWEFMISWQITNVPGGTASPFNAIATF